MRRGVEGFFKDNEAESLVGAPTCVMLYAYDAAGKANHLSVAKDETLQVPPPPPPGPLQAVTGTV